MKKILKNGRGDILVQKVSSSNYKYICIDICAQRSRLVDTKPYCLEVMSSLQTCSKIMFITYLKKKKNLTLSLHWEYVERNS